MEGCTKVQWRSNPQDLNICSWGDLGEIIHELTYSNYHINFDLMRLQKPFILKLLALMLDIWKTPASCRYPKKRAPKHNGIDFKHKWGGLGLISHLEFTRAQNSCKPIASPKMPQLRYTVSPRIMEVENGSLQGWFPSVCPIWVSHAKLTWNGDLAGILDSFPGWFSRHQWDKLTIVWMPAMPFLSDDHGHIVVIVRDLEVYKINLQVRQKWISFFPVQELIDSVDS